MYLISLISPYFIFFYFILTSVIRETEVKIKGNFYLNTFLWIIFVYNFNWIIFLLKMELKCVTFYHEKVKKIKEFSIYVTGD